MLRFPACVLRLPAGVLRATDAPQGRKNTGGEEKKC